ncbi:MULTISPECIES: hypothetical protein [Inquilinus]|uniref:Uncharacterized protein n=1 Tax=Inquilinus ginsengisoli TaxID=363840 RepID=A0ABU1JMZ7_9PROT|nr:hypothetical protein [Inquilinus ginsengisoli]MDR6289989.1 hypothetical protein [Inquilinus ginsengisoli]
MPLFPDSSEAQAKGQHVVCAFFVLFAFKSQPIRVWEGDGEIVRGGQTWQGIGHRQDGQGNPLQSIDGLEQAINGTAPQLSLTLSGVDARVVAAAKKDAAADEIEGQPITIWLGFYDATMPGLVELDGLIPIGTWIMQKPSFTATGPIQRTIALPAETLFAQRSRAPFGLLTDRDQQRRFPGDKALEFVPKMVDRTVTWPRF